MRVVSKDVGQVNIPCQKEPPFSLALSQAWKSLQVRRLRHLSAGSGILLAIALYVSVRTSILTSPIENVEAMIARERMNWLVFLSLLICFVGVTNSMVLSVTERYQEIGTLKCLGATDSFIIKVFFCEAGMLGFSASVVGGFLGIPASLFAKVFGEALTSWSKLFESWSIAFGEALVLGMVLSILSVVFPALHAAKLPPVVALRVDI